MIFKRAEKKYISKLVIMRTRFWSNRDFLRKQSYTPFYFYILLFFVIVVAAVTQSQFSLHSSSCPLASESQAAIKGVCHHAR